MRLRVVFTAVARDGDQPSVIPDPIAVNDPSVRELLAEQRLDEAGPLNPGDLLPVLRKAVGRQQGASPGELVALLRLVLVADAYGMVLHCT